jgi:hypothetical protein
MSVHSEHIQHPGSALKGMRVLVLALFAVVTAIVAVSFAAHHMRIGFEDEYASQVEKNATFLASTCTLAIEGNDLVTDPNLAAIKYKNVLTALLVQTQEENHNTKLFGLYTYSNGMLNHLLLSSPTGLVAASIPVTEWMTVDSKPYIIKSEGKVTIITPVKDSAGNVVGAFELSETYTFLESYGNKIEQRVLMSVVVSVICGMILFSLQYVMPVIIQLVRNKGSEEQI